MPLDASLRVETLRSWFARLDEVWRPAILRLAGACTFVMLVFYQDWLAMAGQWWNSSTYNHILLVPSIIVWLIWLRLPQLAKLAPQCWWPGILALGSASLVWLLGAVSGLDLIRQTGAVAMLPALVLTLLGPRIAWGLAFPLAYCAFLVPFGDELIPPMQTVTAVITIWLTRLSGIPATINGVFIDTPAGLFVVAEACSGVKFLVAMFAFGVLAAHVCFRSWTRRSLFLLVALIVPILANGVRAWGTIYFAQFYGAEKAAGFDHIVYGWLFFAAVIALVIALAWRWFDRSPDDRFIDSQALAQAPLLDGLEQHRMKPANALIGLIAVCVSVSAWAAAADRIAAPVPNHIVLPEVSGWKRTDYAPTVWWEPRASGAEHRLLGSYTDPAGRKVDVFLALYSGQGEGREAGGFGEGALMFGKVWAWTASGPAIANGRSERLIGNGTVSRLAETYYRTGGLLTGSNTGLKLATMRDRILLQGRTTTLLILSAEDRPGQPAEPAIAAFRQSAGPLDSWMDRIVQIR